MKMRGIPYIFETDGGIITPHENFLKRYIKRLLIRGASCYLSPSKETDSYLTYYGAFQNTYTDIHFLLLHKKIS